MRNKYENTIILLQTLINMNQSPMQDIRVNDYKYIHYTQFKELA